MVSKTNDKSNDKSIENTATLQLAQALIERPSLTPNDAGCQALIAKSLKKMGFTVHSLAFDTVLNLWAIYGNKKPLFVFAGHSDVVPAGPLKEWKTPPFTPTTQDGFLYGRGAADMKGSLAAMVTAIQRFLIRYPNFEGSLGILITSDEEGPAHHGTRKVVEYLKDQKIHLDYCLVGEPSSQATLGDTIKIGRRGSLSGKLTVKGIQGHIAYPDRTINPIHLAMKPLTELITKTWDSGSLHFPPTSFQISNLNAGTGAGNVTPGQLECWFNFRFSNEQTPEHLQAAVHQILDSHAFQYDLEWEISSLPFLSNPARLLNACQDAIQTLLNITPTLSTSGGSSDARFIAPLGTEVIELGPRNTTIHQVNECIEITELNQLSELYEQILINLLASQS